MIGTPILAPDAPAVAPISGIRSNRAHLSPLVWLMGLSVFFFPIQFEASTINLAPSDLFLGAAVVLCFFRLRFVRPAWSFVHMALILCFLWAAGTSAYLHGSVSTYVVVKIAGLFALFASYVGLTSAAARWREIRLLIRIFIFATSLHALIAVTALAAGISAPWLNYDATRASGMLLDPNAFGGLVMVALLLQIGSYVTGRAVISGWLGIAVTASLAVGLFLTLSRSAWIGFVLGFILISFLRPRAVVIGAVLAAALAGGLFLWVESQTSARNEVLVDRQNTALQRIEQIRQALPMFTSHPVLGVGLGEFDLLSDPAGVHPLIIHNTTVWILTEMGLVGLSVYVAFVTWFFRRGLIALKIADLQGRSVIVGLLGAHAGMLGLSTGIEVLYQRHWWFVMALLACSGLAASRELVFRSGAH
jgi:putative inorganic carbon (HCO3(-)) transporter